MGRLIDTSIFIEAERGRLDLDLLLTENDDRFFMSVITASELLHGIHRAAPEYKSTRIETIEGWIDRFEILDIDIAIARAHARLFADLKNAGQIIGPHDLWLAASCLANRLGIVTANIREFVRVPGLLVENWSERK